MEQEHLPSDYTIEENDAIFQQRHLSVVPQVTTGPHGPFPTHDEMLKDWIMHRCYSDLQSLQEAAAMSRRHLFTVTPPIPPGPSFFLPPSRRVPRPGKGESWGKTNQIVEFGSTIQLLNSMILRFQNIKGKFLFFYKTPCLL